MSIGALTIVELRLNIAESRRRQEMYLGTIADAAFLAAEQVQDMRIELLEKGPELTASDLLLDFLQSTALGMAGELIGVATGHFLTAVVRTRGAVSSFGAVLKLSEKLTITGVNRALNLHVTQETFRKATPERTLLKEFSKLKGVVIEKGKESAKKGLAAVKKQGRPDGSPAGASAGVAFSDAILGYVRQQLYAMNTAHDIIDIHIASGLLEDDEADAWRTLLKKTLKTESEQDGRDLTNLGIFRDQLTRLFEACIWSQLFSARTWKDLVRPIIFPPLLVGGGRLAEADEEVDPGIPVSKELVRYWVERFSPLPDFKWGQRTGKNDAARIRWYFRDVLDKRLTELLDSGDVVQMTRPPQQKHGSTLWS